MPCLLRDAADRLFGIAPAGETAFPEAIGPGRFETFVLERQTQSQGACRFSLRDWFASVLILLLSSLPMESFAAQKAPTGSEALVRLLKLPRLDAAYRSAFIPAYGPVFRYGAVELAWETDIAAFNASVDPSAGEGKIGRAHV